MTKRVVVTGMAGLTALGHDWPTIKANMQAGHNAVTTMPEWQMFEGLHTRLAAPIRGFVLPSHYTRKQTRAMGRVAQLATVASENALIDAKLLDNNTLLASSRMGVAYGSCAGSSQALLDLASIYHEKSTKGVTATTYVKAMSHTCAVNVALFFGITGRVLTTCSACTSGSQALGYAYEAIKNGYQDMMLAGGAEELCPSQASVFDTLYATSQKNDTPALTPRPFDRDRDGLVLGEGACTIILEEYEHALARGAQIYAELVGFGTNCDAGHITQPEAASMQSALHLALDDANLSPAAIGYISAHGTATAKGDVSESQATNATFGEHMPISSMKSYFGHTLGACGAMESWLAINMMNDGEFQPTLNLNNPDPACAPLDYLQSPRQLETDYVMSNNFAFGGINTSLIFKRV